MSIGSGTCVALGAMGFILASALAGHAPLEAASLPFDPPGMEEQAWALQAALLDPRVDGALSERFEPIGAALRTEKSSSPVVRLLDVWFYDYASDVVVWVVFDPQQGSVVRLEEGIGRFEPPLTANEDRRAAETALANRDVIDHLEGRSAQTATRLLHGPGTPCPTNRCALVSFSYDGSYDAHFFAIVNLNEDVVVAVVADWGGVP